jgi:hypothetical protein
MATYLTKAIAKIAKIAKITNTKLIILSQVINDYLHSY